MYSMEPHLPHSRVRLNKYLIGCDSFDSSNLMKLLDMIEILPETVRIDIKRINQSYRINQSFVVILKVSMKPFIVSPNS